MIDFLLSLMGGGSGGSLAWIGAAIAGAVALFFGGQWKGRRDQKQKQQAEEHNRYVTTRKRVDDAFRDADGSDAEWLSERGRRKP